MAKLVNFKNLLNNAYKNKYAVAHININNLEWIKAVLTIANETKTPVILGVSEGAAKYMNGFKNIVDMVNNSLEYLKITVPVVLHLDHGSYEGAVNALKAGFSSVMFDGSSLKIAENIKLTKKIVALAKKYHASVEGEVGGIGGEEDGKTFTGEIASLADCQALVKCGIDTLAAGIGNIHGIYPKN
jgi:fructose-bisphosphate aldolase class II